MPSDICGASEFDRPSQEKQSLSSCSSLMESSILLADGERSVLLLLPSTELEPLYIYIYIYIYIISLIDLVCRRDSVIVSGHWLVKPVSK